jgi:DNA-binding NarL/FixJ family response regulator
VSESRGVMRDAGDRPFSDEDREVLHLVHLGAGCFYAPTALAVRLAPRVRQTLEVLLDGASNKEIAVRLDLSTHTVRQYVKVIFKAHGVTSRAELIARSSRRLVAPPP